MTVWLTLKIMLIRMPQVLPQLEPPLMPWEFQGVS
jgi:hypothetical protein